MVELILVVLIVSWAGYFLWNRFRPKKINSCGACSGKGSCQGCGAEVTIKTPCRNKDRVPRGE